jgi:osmoprotectant transport system substrate-binding protein
MGTMIPSARRRLLSAVLVIAVGSSLAACGSADASDSSSGTGIEITVGSQGTTESEILASLYGQVLADRGYTVDYNEGIGARESFIPALQAGTIDLVPDTAGELLYGVDAAAFARSSDDIEEALPDALEPLGLFALRLAPAQNADAFVVSAEYSRDNQVTSIGDLAYQGDSITIGAGEGFESRRYGRAGLLSSYRVSGFDFKQIDDGAGAATVSELLTGAVQVAVIPSTTPSISRNNLVVLSDPNNLITAENVVPVVNGHANTSDVRRLVDPVSRALTTAELRDLNERASASANPAVEAIAHDWLVRNDFLG